MVIDDNQMVLKTIKSILSEFGWNHVEIARDGGEGIQKFEKGNFRLVITDIEMPVVDGNGVARHIRNSAKKHTPIIAVSGVPLKIENKWFDSVIEKPFSIKVLMDAVEDLAAGASNKVPRLLQE